jgi:hypothetical protein
MSLRKKKTNQKKELPPRAPPKKFVKKKTRSRQGGLTKKKMQQFLGELLGGVVTDENLHIFLVYPVSAHPPPSIQAF